MNHYYKSIQGWFDWENIYQAWVHLAPAEPCVMVELGAWKGCSTAFLATEIKNSGKPITFDVVDSFDGSGREGEYDTYTHEFGTLRAQFDKNMEPVAGHYNVKHGKFTDVAAQYQDGSIDFLFFDGCCHYEGFVEELAAWLPKVKEGGWIGGHDFVGAPEGVGFAVPQQIPNYKTNGNSWYARKGGGDTSALDSLLTPAAPVFSQAVGPDQSNAYYRGKYATAATPAPQTGDVTPDRQEYMRGKYAAF